MATNPSPSAALVEIDSVTLRIGARTLVRDLSLKVHGGEVWCILGANGVGKTSLLNSLVGLRAVDGGSIRITGRPVDDWDLEEAARFRGFLPQAVHDAFSARVIDVVLLGRHPHLARWAWEDDADRDIAMLALRDVGLDQLAERDITTLSGGERQRVAIAALLAQDVPLMLLDEPVTHLDLHHQIIVLQHLTSLAHGRGRAAVYSIHDLNLANRFASHAMIFLGDATVSHGPIGEVMNAATLSKAFGYPVMQASIGPRTVFIPE